MWKAKIVTENNLLEQLGEILKDEIEAEISDAGILQPNTFEFFK
jgi:hypothetical protein